MALTRRAALALPGCLAVPACAQGAGLLATLRPVHPRLLTTPEQVATLPARLEAEPAGRRWRTTLLRDADGLLARPPAERRFEARRPVLLPTSRDILRRTEALGVAFLLTADPRYAARLAAEMRAAAAYPDWNPSHFLDVAEMTTAFALALDWCHAAWPEADRAMARDAIIAKGLRPGLDGFRSRAFWTRVTHNWALVCMGGLVCGALAVAEDAPTLAAEILSLALPAARPALASYAPDGAWDEGVAYWDYATQYAVFLLAALDTALGANQGLSALPGLAEAGLFRLHLEGPTGRVFNFADGGESVRNTPALMWLARRYHAPAYAWLIGRAPGVTGTGLLWYQPGGQSPAALGLPLDARFRHVEAASLRGAWGDPAASWIAFKGGDNAANHGNLDLGTFVMEAGGERFAIDLGADDYALPGYFSAARRFTYYRNATAGQNTLLVDGADQPMAARAAITAFRSEPGFARAVADLSAGYPALVSARRGIALLDRRVMVVADEVTGSAGRRLRWQMHTRAAVALDGPAAVLRQGSAMLQARILEPAGAVFTLDSATRPPPENPNTGVQRLVVEAMGAARIVVAFAPGEAARDDQLAPIRRPLAAWA
ncbi:heparinase II/III domain-containing protein [Falsiroseomonas stagni]|uniref:Heparinase II/III-like protein n=1 Tax=Falsiroseomonas stagni DSM 19981 TaxID=1123062 RepID=A0A1I4F2G0_9PROT|nr:heparinase II/III family protein [Falsiroseomonas stagni]SFL11749.1 Heparinase II/III-like protein [Falsiroseomonas stagni DSM 19981]